MIQAQSLDVDGRVCRQADAGPSCQPSLSSLLRSLRLDYSFHRAEGSQLFYRDDRDGREVPVLDLVSGYGSVLLGHNHPELVAEALRLLEAGCPVHSQGSIGRFAHRFADALNARAGGGYRVVFANSGAEAVEAAMKHAMLQTGGRTFVAIDGGFHGKTLGAVQLAGNAAHRRDCVISGIRVIRVGLNDVGGLDAAFEAAPPDLAGLIFEPVQGEGGVRPIDAAFLAAAAGWCRARAIPLIADECQTGAGRTGRYFACERLGVRPDYILSSKALGGGLAKVAALLVAADRYDPRFDLRHTSTFAGDEFSCAIGLKALRLTTEEILRDVREKGERLMSGFRRLAREYPAVIREVRGAGLLIGVQFCEQDASASFLLRTVSARNDLAKLLASYLLNAHSIRVAPTLGEPLTLRVQPAVCISMDEIEMVIRAFGRMCDHLGHGASVELVRHLSAAAGPSSNAGADWNGEDAPLLSESGWVAHDGRGLRDIESTFATPPLRVAWLCHLIDPLDLGKLESSLADQSDAANSALLNRQLITAKPIVFCPTDIRSAHGVAVRFFPVLLPFTSAGAADRLRRGGLMLPRSLIQRGIEAAESLNCRVAALGQYTSILTGNGRTLLPGTIGITTGNAYAIALAIDAIERAMSEAGYRSEDQCLAVVGAAGNIGQTVAEILAPRFRCTLLIGSSRRGSARRLARLARRIPRAGMTTCLGDVRAARVVVAALNTAIAPIHVRDFAAGTVVCDLSVPSAVHGDASGSGVQIIRGGVARLPGGESFAIPGFPLAPGRAFGCMIEAVILALEGGAGRRYTGTLTPDHVESIRSAAGRHGFGLADFNRTCVLDPRSQAETAGARADWSRLMESL